MWRVGMEGGGGGLNRGNFTDFEDSKQFDFSNFQLIPKIVSITI